MIQVDSVHIEEVRGIRKLDLVLDRKNFAVYGPNGSGKSGVIDAIEFALTGQIGRLTGRGTKGLSVVDHGPHIDAVRFPDAAFVELTVTLLDLRKTVTIRRHLSSPKKLAVTPDLNEVREALEEVAKHPELTLSRREILRFILVEPSKRSEEIQAILKMEEVGLVRGALKTAQNRLGAELRHANARLKSCKESLQLHLQVSTLSQDSPLRAVNEKRRLLDLSELQALTGETKLDLGLSDTVRTSSFNRESALGDIAALADTVTKLRSGENRPATLMLAEIRSFLASPALLTALRHRSLVERGLELADGAECPLCDLQWQDSQALVSHLKAKLTQSQEALKRQESIRQKGMTLAETAMSVARMLMPVHETSKHLGYQEVSQLLHAWMMHLARIQSELLDPQDLPKLVHLLSGDWLCVPDECLVKLNALKGRVEAEPDETATLNAQTFLTQAQLRYKDYVQATLDSHDAQHISDAARTAYAEYCSVMEHELTTLYQDVQKDFSSYYRTINESDESGFTAKFTPSQGSLSLDVNFYGRGLFPPVAYHSEGHQDGMGVCLYLALMKRLFGRRFSVCLLDDVVMSVDSSHRYQFCKLLRQQFPETQFVITTHDRLWSEQMKSAGLIDRKGLVSFHSWTIDSGPRIESGSDVWQEIEQALQTGRVDVAAASLRHHLEYVSYHLADLLGATPRFRADGGYELGDLLPSALGRMRKLYGEAAKAAQSWRKEDKKQIALARKEVLSKSNGAYQVERWAVNRAVHYNEWANFGRADFVPVVEAFRELLKCFSCVECGAWLYVTPRQNPEALRCGCAAININLKPKSN